VVTSNCSLLYPWNAGPHFAIASAIFSSTSSKRRKPMEKELAAALALLEFPHRDWTLLPEYTQDQYTNDIRHFLDAVELAGYTLTPKEAT
jgi:hypothetical protein